MPENKQILDVKDFTVGSIESYWNIYLQKFEDCKKDFSEQAVHDFRVSIRRLSSLLLLINHVIPSYYFIKARKILKKQLKIFSPLRDTQVQILEMQSIINEFPVLYTFYNNLLNKEKEYITEIRNRLLKLDTIYLEGILLFLNIDIKKYLSENEVKIEQFIIAVIKAHDNVLNKYTFATAENLSSIHQVRLAFKKFRYMMEILRTITSIPDEEFKKMKAFQTILGRVQDNSVLSEDLHNFIISQAEIPFTAYQLAEEEILKRRQVLIEEFLSSKNIIEDLGKSLNFLF